MYPASEPPRAMDDGEVDYFDVENRDLPAGLDLSVRGPIIKARQASIRFGATPPPGPHSY